MYYIRHFFGVYLSTGVEYDLFTNVNVTESDNATFELCVTLRDFEGGLERDVTFEIKRDFGFSRAARSK